jgi:hypothetical protein
MNATRRKYGTIVIQWLPVLPSLNAIRTTRRLLLLTRLAS